MEEDTKIFIEISPQNEWWKINFREFWAYRDLLILFIKRDFVAFYKQTILGPLWYLLQPLLTTGIFVFVFNNIAGIGTDGIPPVLFYFSGLVLWNFFSQCVLMTSNTFLKNANIFGKVYFPRIIVPVSIIFSNMISFGVQFLLFIGIWIYNIGSLNVIPHYSYILYLPLIIIGLAILGLGLGLILSSITTKYRDFSFLLTFGIQLLMYGSPIIYSLSTVSEKYKLIIMANPISSYLELFRFVFLGKGIIEGWSILYSIFFTIIVLFVGIFMFNKTEKNFMDVI